MRKILTTSSVRSFVFGVEDSLVSTIGLVSGIAVVGTNRSTIITTGIILILVEAFSMAVGELLSENSAEEFQNKKYIALSKSFIPSVIMFISYTLAGMVVLLPYFFWEGGLAFKISLGASAASLFLLGVVSAKFARISPVRKGLIMVIVGGSATAIGIVAGLILNLIFIK